MTARKKPESNSGNLLETTNDWLRDFLKHLELFMVETVRSLLRWDNLGLSLAAVRAIKR